MTVGHSGEYPIGEVQARSWIVAGTTNPLAPWTGYPYRVNRAISAVASSRR